MKCLSCGYENTDGNKFCSACGAKLPDASEISLDTPASDIIGNDSVDEAVSSGIDEALSNAEESVSQAASDMEDAVDNAFEQMKDDAGKTDDKSDTAGSFYEESSYSSSDVYDEGQGGKAGFAIASLVCGCLSIICCCGGCCAFPLAAAGIGLGVYCIMKNLEGRGLAIGGIATGGVGILLQIIFTIAAYSNDVFSEIFGAL